MIAPVPVLRPPPDVTQVSGPTIWTAGGRGEADWQRGEGSWTGETYLFFRLRPDPRLPFVFFLLLFSGFSTARSLLASLVPIFRSPTSTARLFSLGDTPPVSHR